MKIDYSNATTGRTQAPEGTHFGTLIGYDIGKSANGADMITFEFSVGEDYWNLTLRNMINGKDNNSFLMRTHMSLDPDNFNQGVKEVDWNLYRGQIVTLEVGTRTYNEKDYADIKRISPAPPEMRKPIVQEEEVPF